jgi:hypothetical protein
MQTTSTHAAVPCAGFPLWRAELHTIDDEKNAGVAGNETESRPLWTYIGNESPEFADCMSELAKFIEQNQSLLLERKYLGQRCELRLHAAVSDFKLILKPKILTLLAALSISIRFHKELS